MENTYNSLALRIDFKKFNEFLKSENQFFRHFSKLLLKF
jgi:hypothetical protein